MAEDRGRITRSGALGREDRREERFLDEVRREIRREVATVIRAEVVDAVLGDKDNWERLERLLVQQAEEEKQWWTFFPHTNCVT
jgi:predicted Ser/Thr protein kinase